MRKIRALIVDDSVVARRLVAEVLEADPGIEVAGVAASGRIALAKIPTARPDVVILDLEMPEMDGLQTLEAIRAAYSGLPVLMFSALTPRAATATLRALSLGACDFITKPANTGGLGSAKDEIREALIPRVKFFGGGRVGHPRDDHPAVSIPAARPARRVEIVAIGVSTGGPEALCQLLPSLPADFPVPIVIVQHMPPVFTRFLAQSLAARSAIGVTEACAGERLRPGQAWVAPGGSHMVVRGAAGSTCLEIDDGPPENSCRPSVDVLFRSVAAVYGPASLAVILTGMGRDGLAGCEAIRAAGGQILAQDEATSVVWGMPGYVARAGLADRVLPLQSLGAEILARINVGRSLAGWTSRSRAMIPDGRNGE